MNPGCEDDDREPVPLGQLVAEWAATQDNPGITKTAGENADVR